MEGYFRDLRFDKIFGKMQNILTRNGMRDFFPFSREFGKSSRPTDLMVPGGVLLGILGGGVPLGSPNPDPISDQKMLMSTPVFRPGLQAEIMLLRLARKQQILQIHFEFVYIFFFLAHLELKRLIRSYAPVVPSKTIPDSRPKWAQHIPVFRPKRSKKPYPMVHWCLSIKANKKGWLMIIQLKLLSSISTGRAHRNPTVSTSS